MQELFEKRWIMPGWHTDQRKIPVSTSQSGKWTYCMILFILNTRDYNL